MGQADSQDAGTGAVVDSDDVRLELELKELDERLARKKQVIGLL